MSEFFFLQPEHILDKWARVRSRSLKRSAPYLMWLPENEDDSTFVPEDYHLANGIPTLTRHLADFGEGGLACFVGAPNHGKTTLLTNANYHLLRRNPDLVLVDCSFDDSFAKRVQQYVACAAAVPYHIVGMRRLASEQQLDRIAEAERELLGFIRDRRLVILESIESGEKVFTIQSFSNVVALMGQMRSDFPGAKILVTLDSVHDMDTSTNKSFSEIGQEKYWNDRLRAVSFEKSVGVLASAHLRKGGTTERGKSIRRVTLDDLKGSVSFAFNALYVGYVENEVRSGFYQEPLTFFDGTRLRPVLKVVNLKNKVSDWTLPLFYRFYQNQNRLEPVERGEYSEYLSIVSSKREIL